MSFSYTFSALKTGELALELFEDSFFNLLTTYLYDCLSYAREKGQLTDSLNPATIVYKAALPRAVSREYMGGFRAPVENYSAIILDERLNDSLLVYTLFREIVRGLYPYISESDLAKKVSSLLELFCFDYSAINRGAQFKLPFLIPEPEFNRAHEFSVLACSVPAIHFAHVGKSNVQVILLTLAVGFFVTSLFSLSSITGFTIASSSGGVFSGVLFVILGFISLGLLSWVSRFTQ